MDFKSNRIDYKRLYSFFEIRQRSPTVVAAVGVLPFDEF